MDIKALEKKAREIRATCIQMSYDGNVGHLSSALSYVDILVALYYNWLKIFPDNPANPGRDRFILSKGHGCASLYAVLADRGFFPAALLSEYNRENSLLPCHPCTRMSPYIEMSSGSLGHGLGVATGMLYGMRLRNCESRVVALLGDGECNEGSVWESAMFAAAHRLDRLLAIVDYNGIQAVGHSDEIMGHTSLEEKFRSFGWATKTIDGSDMKSIVATLNQFPFQKRMPSVIIAKTRIGVSFMEKDVLWHYRKPSEEERQRALTELDAKPIYGQKT